MKSLYPVQNGHNGSGDSDEYINNETSDNEEQVLLKVFLEKDSDSDNKIINTRISN